MARGGNPLETYHEKRDFRQTPEPKGRVRKSKGRLYTIQKHAARRLHYDLRLELDGVLKSWAITRGPSLDPTKKRLAVRTEDHPVDYGGFEGVIPNGYGAGTVLLWDRGQWEPKEDPHVGLEKGVLKFTLAGERLKGGFALIRMKNKKGEKRENWLLIKERDDEANADIDPVEIWNDSIETGRNIASIREQVATHRTGAKPRRRTPPRKRASGSAKSGRMRRVKVKFVPPQLATLRDAPPRGEGWLHELKFDGYRIQALIDGGAARLMTRNGKDWTVKYPTIAQALGALDVEHAVIDGELVAVDDSGRSNFGHLQNTNGESGIPLLYYAFDLLHLDGTNLRGKPLIERKALLKSLVAGVEDPVRYSEHIEGAGDRVIEKACALNLEGIISKKASGVYRSGRGRGWIKTKCVGNDEFVIGGYRRSSKRGRPFASLLLGEFVADRLVYRGRVGTGFGEAAFDQLKARMHRLERKSSPFAETPAEARRGAVWLKPDLVAQIAYAEQTAEGRLRHPSYLGLREDKAAEEVQTVTGEKDSGATEITGVRITHPDRVMFPGQGATKREVAEYYARTADRVLPYLAHRPLSLVRCPRGRSEKCFFQKHHNASTPAEISTVMVTEKNGRKSSYLLIDSAAGLVAAAQIGALELHLWGARADRIERPERLVFDLDPDETLDFAQVKRAAVEVRDLLDAAGLDSFALLTGGKGIHVIAPLERRRDWKDIKAFAKGFAVKLAGAAPDRYVASAAKKQRKGRIFIDWLRNERGATAIAPFSLRARSGAPVATPVSWDELSGIPSAAHYTLENIDDRLGRLKHDPWRNYFEVRQSITRAHLDAVA